MGDYVEEVEKKIEGKTTEEAVETMGLNAGTFKLIKPLLVNGKNKKSFKYDFNEIDIVTLKQAGAFAQKVPGNNTDGAMYIMENDYNYHLYLGFAAIVAVNPDVTFRDLERIKGIDLNIIQAAGRNFSIGYMVGQVAEASNSENK